MSKIFLISPAIVHFDDSLAAVPMMGVIAQQFLGAAKADLRAEGAELGAEHDALTANLDEHGIQEPLPVTCYDSKGREVAPEMADPDACHRLTGWDGRHRAEWATRNKKRVPVRIVTEAQGRALLEATVIGRRHWTKGQRAWLAICLHPAVAGNSKGRPGKSDSIGFSASTLAARYGVSPDLIGQAVKIHRMFADLPSLREKHEPGIWIGHGLGAVIAGIPGATTTANPDGNNPKKAISWTTLKTPLSTLSNVARAFSKWTDEEKDCARDAFANWLRGLPEEFRLTLTEAVAQSAEGEAAE